MNKFEIINDTDEEIIELIVRRAINKRATN